MPSKSISQTVLVSETEHTIEDEHLYPLLFGGDQLSVVQYRGRHCSTNSVERLEGLSPVVEDWHAEVIVLKVSDVS